MFAVGFALGALRVTLLVPRLGDTAAVLLEAPLMLAVSWMAARWSAARWQVPGDPGARLLMGSIAFAILMFAELGLSTLVFGRTVAQHFAGFRSVAGAIGLGAQIAFGVIPWVQRRRNEPPMTRRYKPMP